MDVAGARDNIFTQHFAAEASGISLARGPGACMRNWSTYR
jgi:hypothetical protein